MKDLTFISRQLLSWFAVHKRDLPWRHTHDPYKIWISEIILQQTRVIQGLEYYLRFIERFPNIQTLAEAEEQEVLTYWQGLGYYSRARNLHFTAQTIVNEHQGIFPKSYDAILKLKGIGEYTASAIVSFAWNLPYPAVDGNVFRFLSRLWMIDDAIDTPKGKKRFTQLAQEVMDPKNAGAFNQAIMEFGALQCVPSSPDCSVCPFESNCLAHAQNCVDNYPVKQNKTKTKALFLYYFHIHDSEHLYINRRKGKGIWQNLYEFPMIESEIPLDFEQLSQHPSFQKWFAHNQLYDFKPIINHKKHILSHRILHASFYEVIIKEETKNFSNFTKIKEVEMEKYPVHRLMQYYLEQRRITEERKEETNQPSQT